MKLGRTLGGTELPSEGRLEDVAVGLAVAAGALLVGSIPAVAGVV